MNTPFFKTILLFWLASVFLIAIPSEGCAKLYRYKDENGTIHFTDDILKVPEAQRNDHVLEKNQVDEKQSYIESAPENPFQKLSSPKSIFDKLQAESDALFKEKESLEDEFMEIIKERDRLRQERSIPRRTTEEKIYLDAVFSLKSRIATYLERCDDYEAKVKALNQKMDALEKQASPSGKPVQ